MTYACRVEQLGKRYRTGRAVSRGRHSYRTLQEELVRLAVMPWRRLRNGSTDGREEDFWALRDVDFSIRSGEAVGIIGRNGAGKSTLLKILSRITKPTTGQVELRGRVGSLLEVGTGFHPELTGRENIFLNGAILGMARHEIARKFDEIVAFAEVERFLDTPVKRYSSGMYVRLAFAVAAHLEPEILILDEVLATGDLAFQRKCMGRMSEVGKRGCTVLLVSHNMPAIESICTRAILLDHGRVVRSGAVADVVSEYHRRVMGAHANGVAILDQGGARHSEVTFRSVALLDEMGDPTGLVPLGGPFHIRIGLNAAEPIDYPCIGIGIDDLLGHRLLTAETPLSHVAVERVDGRCEVDCRIESFPLAPGDYWIKLGLNEYEVERAFRFTVANGDAFGDGRGYLRGICVAPSRWSLASGNYESVRNGRLE
jgi:lipopolysaccharide transport system ATP-binding protein